MERLGFSRGHLCSRVENDAGWRVEVDLSGELLDSDEYEALVAEETA